MSTLRGVELAARRMRRRRMRWGIALSPIVGFVGLLAASAVGAFDGYDDAALRDGEFRRRVAAVTTPADSSAAAPDDPAPNAAPPSGLVTAADVWVHAFNGLNDNAITQSEVDAYGNLLIMLDARFDALAPAAQLRVLDGIGAYYRMHLASVTRGLPSRGRFVPGVVLVDTLPGRPAIRGESRNGVTQLFGAVGRAAQTAPVATDSP